MLVVAASAPLRRRVADALGELAEVRAVAGLDELDGGGADVVFLELRAEHAERDTVRVRQRVGAEVPVIGLVGVGPGLRRPDTSGLTTWLPRSAAPEDLRELLDELVPPPVPTTVLLVDDDPIQLKLARLRLELAGYRVVPARDGAEALRLARAAPPDVIVSDVLMPETDGFELCVAIRNDAALAAIPVILQSANFIEPQDAAFAEECGADEFAVKSPTLQGLLDSLVRVARHGPRLVTVPRPDELADAWLARLKHQLALQSALNMSLARRSALRDAELEVLNHIAEALGERRDVRATLGSVLTACVHGGDLSLALLYLHDHDGRYQLRAATARDGLARRNPPPSAEIEPFLRAAEHAGRPLDLAAARVEAPEPEPPTRGGAAGMPANRSAIGVGPEPEDAHSADAGRASGASDTQRQRADPGGHARSAEPAHPPLPGPAPLPSPEGPPAAEASPLPDPRGTSEAARRVLRDLGLSSALLIPLRLSGRELGVLLFGAEGRDLAVPEWGAYARAIGAHVAQAITLARLLGPRPDADPGLAERRRRLAAALGGLAGLVPAGLGLPEAVRTAFSAPAVEGGDLRAWAHEVLGVGPGTVEVEGEATLLAWALGALAPAGVPARVLEADGTWILRWPPGVDGPAAALAAAVVGAHGGEVLRRAEGAGSLTVRLPRA